VFSLAGISASVWLLIQKRILRFMDRLRTNRQQKNMCIWIRTTGSTDVKVVYDANLPLSVNSRCVEYRTAAEDDNTGFVELTGLTPDTCYYYGVVIGDELIKTDRESDTGFASFRTLPDTLMKKKAHSGRGIMLLSSQFHEVLSGRLAYAEAI